MRFAISKSIAIKETIEVVTGDHIGVYHTRRSPISKAIAIKETIEVVTGDQMCDRDQVGVYHTRRSAIRKAIVISKEAISKAIMIIYAIAMRIND